MAFFKAWPVDIEDEDTGEMVEVFVDFYFYPAASGNYYAPDEPAYVDITAIKHKGAEYGSYLSFAKWQHIESILLESLLSA